jgi:hypothetical protein
MRSGTPPNAGRWRRRVSRRAAGVIIGGLAAMGTTGALVASAAIPTAPDNIVVFPDRDFLSLEGYQDYVDKTARIEVIRNGQVVGSAVGKIAEGDPALEINHPGGICWGAGTDLKVTPDIIAGDKVTLKIDGTDIDDDTIVQKAAVDTDTTLDETTRTLLVKGYIADGVNQAQVEQRIVNPDLVDLIGRRDVRALPGDVVPSDKGGYSSGLSIGGGKFTATYVFDTLEAARTAAGGGGERFMAWQAEGADAARQGLTIAEYGELGGPGMGGCPAGPADAPAPQGTYSAVRSDDGKSIVVNWSGAKAVPGAEPITGYTVAAIEPGSGSTPRPGTLMRTDASGTRVTLAVNDTVPDYEIEVRSMAGTKMSEPFPLANAPSGAADTEPPTVTASPAPIDGQAVEASAVKLTADDTGADIYYTTDGTPARDAGDLPSAKAKLYTGPIAIGRATETTEINWVAFDSSGNSSGNHKGLYKPPPLPDAPLAPSGLAGVPSERSVALSWNAVDRATAYQVTVSSAGNKLATQPSEVTGTSQTVSGLTAGTDYEFTVTAKNEAGSAASEPITVKTLAATERLTITQARWKSDDFRVGGSSTASSGTVSVYIAVTDPVTTKVVPAANPIPGMTNRPLTAAVAPATGSSYDIRLRTGVPSPKPAQIFVKSSNGGIAGPFNVANG